MEMILKNWEEKSRAFNDDCMNEKTRTIFIEMLESQRKYLAELNKDPSIDEEIIRNQLVITVSQSLMDSEMFISW